jgi:DNA gyrase subunit A
MGVKFVTPKGDDTVAVVARSVERPEEDEAEEAEDSEGSGSGATIENEQAEPAGTEQPTEEN